MDQQAFKTMLENEGFEVVVVEREANKGMDLHSHPFERSEEHTSELQSH